MGTYFSRVTEADRKSIQAFEGNQVSVSIRLLVAPNGVALGGDTQTVEQPVRVVEIGANLVDLQDLAVVAAGIAADRKSVV